MGEIFGAAGQIASSAIQAGAIKDATQMQIDALNKQRDFVFQNLDPATVNAAALSASQQQAANRLALQGKIDPTLLAQRYASEQNIAKQAGSLGAGPAQAVGNVAAQEAVAGAPGAKDAQKALIDAALKELDAGATLPPDVQAEIVQTGLEKTGQMTQTANATGFGGQTIRKLLGTAGINLQFQRQQQAAQLTSQAQQLEESRQKILGTLFPNLSTVQLNTLTGSQNVLKQANDMTPQAGLSGNDIANVWLSRVGATNTLAQSAADAAARGGIAQGQVWGSGLGTAVGYGSRALPSTQSVWNSAVNSNPDSNIVY